MVAAVEMQRILRGGLGRSRVRKLRREVAAITIARILRGHLGRKKTRLHRFNAKGKWAVRVVEDLWAVHKWRRAMKKRKEFEKQIKAVCEIQRVYRGYRGRTSFRALLYTRTMSVYSVVIQCAFRSYLAKVRMDALAAVRRKGLLVTSFQALVRGHLGRLNVKKFHIHLARARTIQKAYRKHVSWERFKHVKRWSAAINIQRIGRGWRSRRRVRRLKNARNQASGIIWRNVYGFHVYKQWGPILRAYVTRRRVAATALQRKFMALYYGRKVRKRLAEMQYAALVLGKAMRCCLRRKIEVAAWVEVRTTASVKIQSSVRVLLSKKRVERILKARGWIVPLYYRLREMYYNKLNRLYFKEIVRMQCLFRVVRARLVMKMKVRNRAASDIQYFWWDYLMMKGAKEELRQLRVQHLRRIAAAKEIQRVGRGYMGRYEARKHYLAETVKWFLIEISACGRVGQIMQKFRVRKRAMDRTIRAATKIQALGRRYNARKWIIKNHKRLTKELQKRIRRKKERAATIIASKFFRVVLARRLVVKRRLIMAEFEKERKLLEELEEKLDVIHEEHMTNLLAIRMQSGGRSLLAKKAFAVRSLMHKAEKETAYERLLFNSAARIQALARGRLARKNFTKNLAQLQRAAQVRDFCVECEINMAIKRCRQCKDNFCNSCFDKTHKKGRRRLHGWFLIEKAQLKEAPTTSAQQIKPSNTAKKKKDIWEEFYDESAKAKYWFNVETNEATWISPFR